MGRHTHKTKPTCDQINFSDVFYYRYLIIFHIYCIMFHIYAQGTIFCWVTKVIASWFQLSKHDQWGISTKVAITNHSYLELLNLISFWILGFHQEYLPLWLLPLTTRMLPSHSNQAPTPRFRPLQQCKVPWPSCHRWYTSLQPPTW